VKITNIQAQESAADNVPATDSKKVGNLNATSPIVINGIKDGDIISESINVLGLDIFLSGSIEGKEVVITGEIHGTISAKMHLTLEPITDDNVVQPDHTLRIQPSSKLKKNRKLIKETPTINLKTKQA